MAGCPFQVVSPQAMQTTSHEWQLVDGKIRITVTFNRNVDRSSLVEQTNVILVTERDLNASISIDPPVGSPPTNQITITSDDDASDLLIYDMDGFFSLRLLGSGSNPIRSIEGDILDGDGNGTAGGDYETGFVHVG
jgi:hypothetical protein